MGWHGHVTGARPRLRRADMVAQSNRFAYKAGVRPVRPWWRGPLRAWPEAGIAQLVEHLICNQGVAGSNPAAGTNEINALRNPNFI
jgi:hypothetical protein